MKFSLGRVILLTCVVSLFMVGWVYAGQFLGILPIPTFTCRLPLPVTYQ